MKESGDGGAVRTAEYQPDPAMTMIDKLSPVDGDMILFHHDGTGRSIVSIEALARGVGAELKRRGLMNLILAVIGPEVKVSQLSESDMNAAGWFRKPPEAKRPMTLSVAVD